VRETNYGRLFDAAAALRAEDPDAFGVLTTTPWPFGYTDQSATLRARQPLISLTADGRITAVRLNNRSMQPLRLPAGQAAAAYAAYRSWAALVGRAGRPGRASPAGLLRRPRRAAVHPGRAAPRPMTAPAQ
jgi:hypothetical protein